MAPAWEGSNRRARLPRDWRARRARVLRRDGYRCTVAEYGEQCPEPASDVDHVERGDDHSETNLASLCAWHHGRKSGHEGGTAAAANRTPRARPPEPHPGEIPCASS